MNAQQATYQSNPKGGAPAGPDLRLVQSLADTQGGIDESHSLPADHIYGDAQGRRVGGQLLDPDQCCTDDHLSSVGVDPLSQPSTKDQPTAKVDSSDGWLELRIWAEMFSDAQLARIAAVNRSERGGVDSMLYEGYLAALKNAEHQCDLAMVRCLRRVTPKPIIEWQKASAGIGEHQLALLLGHLGHPRIATPHHWEGTGAKRVLVADEPYERGVAQLWQYCGHGKSERLRKGMSANDLAAMGKPRLKSIVWNISCACLKAKAKSPYGPVYDDARYEYADRVHATDCVRCGPSGKPAATGSPWSLAHQHAAALRKVGKEILRDLWKVSA